MEDIFGGMIKSGTDGHEAGSLQNDIIEASNQREDAKLIDTQA